MRNRATALSSVSNRRVLAPSFSWVNNASLRTALIEAAATGLVLGMSAPGDEDNWLRGVRQGPLAGGVTGATYTRSGTRAGFDPANMFAPNVVRREAGRGVRVHGAGTNLIRSSDAPSTQSVTVSATAHTLSFYGTGSVTLSGAATGTLNGTGADNRVSLTFTPTAGALTMTVSGSVTIAQLETGTVATDYIRNTSTTGSASAGADILLVDYTFPSEFTVIVDWIEPPAYPARLVSVTAGSNPSILELASSTFVSSFNGTVGIDGATAARAAGSSQRAIFRQTAAGRQIHYNGAQIAADANIFSAITQTAIGGITSGASGSLRSSTGIISFIPRDIGAAAANPASIL